MKAMILYYSRSGKTRKLAQRIQADLNADILEIVPEVPYGNYLQALIRAIKQRRANIMPKCVTPIPDLSGYDVVLIGYPIWMSDPPTFESDFLRKCDFTGKKVIPFATFGGSGIAGTLPTIKRVCAGAEVIDPFALGMFKKDDYDAWRGAVQKLLGK